jgi:exopolysaccharide production protein ExoY
MRNESLETFSFVILSYYPCRCPIFRKACNVFSNDASKAMASSRTAQAASPRSSTPQSGMVPRRMSTWQRLAKRTFDIVGSLAFLILFAPLLITIALCVGLTSGWPVHYRQTRIGRGGRWFHFYKFRSMVRASDQALRDHLRSDPAARAEWDAFQHLRKDPRITPVGRYIRKFSLDELPQFWNVLIGDMSLVGPRPCMQRQASLYGDAWGHYCAVRPGITGLWQVSGRNRLTFAQRVALDVKYIDEWSLRRDLSILLRTVRAVAAGD